MRQELVIAGLRVFALIAAGREIESLAANRKLWKHAHECNAIEVALYEAATEQVSVTYGVWVSLERPWNAQLALR